MPFVKGPIALLRGGKMIPAGKAIEVSEEEAKQLEAKGFSTVDSQNESPKENFGGLNMLPENETGVISENNGYEFSENEGNSAPKVLSGGKSEAAPKMGKGTSVTKKSSTVKSSTKASTTKKGE